MSSPRRIAARNYVALPLAAAITLAGCSQDSLPAIATPSPGASPSPSTTRVVRTTTPLPPLATTGVFAHHGGLVAAAGPLFVELTVEGGKARVYVYDAHGQPLAPAEARGELTVSVGDQKTTHPLARQTEGSDVLLAGGKDLPARFAATVALHLGKEDQTASIEWTQVGTRGTWDTVAAPAPAPSPSPTAP